MFAVRSRKPVDGHPALGPGQRRAGAVVDAVTEGDVLAGVGPVDVELVRVLEQPRVAVARPGGEHQRAPGRDVDAAERGAHPAPCGTAPAAGSRAAASPR